MTDTERMRDDIERTRNELNEDVDALAEKVRPSSIAHRQVGRVRNAVTSVKDRVMGVGEDAAEGVAQAPRAVARQAQGHPVAVGLIAFGAGLLVSALIPSSAKERRLASELQQRAEPLVDELGQAARTAAEHLKEPAREAVDAVKGTATEAVDEVKAEGGAAMPGTGGTAPASGNRMTGGSGQQQ